MEEGAISKQCFPTSALVPKAVTGAERFLLKYPKWDGRGITIAVLDTGVDPEATGLQITSHGELKIIDLIDTTGSGDVDTSCIRRTLTTAEREIEGLSGRTLKIPNEWKNPTGEWHVGMKCEYDFLPSAVKGHSQEHFLAQVWKPRNSSLQAQAARELEVFKSQHPDSSGLSLSSVLEKDNLEAKVEVLANLSSKAVLPGAVYDCIVFHDGYSWSAVIDTTQTGRLDCAEVLKPFKETRQSLKLGTADGVTITVNIYDDGNMLSIVTAAAAHGTHVASIAAAYVPDCQELNGIAPGAKILSIKIGDSRLGTMETASSLIRACSLAVSSEVDIINFSYGEASHWTNKGAVLELMSELCLKHNILFVSSAGNNGPAMSTVGCPGGNTTGIIGVGAFVTPDMMSAEYSMTHKKPGLPFTWSSRGPACDGDLGVCITAPGGAVTSVPNWTLRKSQLMNGTSMSSPNACGCIAALLSALKSCDIPYNPPFIKKIIENTAAPLGKFDCFSIGHGIIQIDKAYDAAILGLPSGLVDIQVSVSGDNGRGIYLREPHQIERFTQVSISVEPKFSEGAGMQEKIEFELHLCLVSTESWVVSPKHLALWNGVRQFKVEVDPRQLPTGVHYAEIRAYLPDDERGPIFRVPVTVIIPNELTNKEKGTFCVSGLEFGKDKIHRFFFHTPEQVTWAELELYEVQCESQARISVHTVQLLPEQSFRENENKEIVTAEPDGNAILTLRVAGGYTMELCLMRYWSELQNVILNLKLTFHSVQPNTSTVTFNGSCLWTSLQVTSAFSEEEIHPEFKLTHYIVSKRPTSHKINPLGSRDVLPNGTQIFELLLTYNFRVNRTTEVRPELPLLNDLLYENHYAGQLWMVFSSSDKQFIFAGDAYSQQYSSKIDKGDYILKLQVRHAKQTELMKLTEMPLCLHLKLASSVMLEVTTSRLGIFSGPKVTSHVLKPGIRTTLYLRAIPDDKLYKCGVQSGDVLSGQFTFSKKEHIRSKVWYRLQYLVGPKVNTVSSKSVSEEPKSQEQYLKALKEFKIEWMKSGVLNAEQLEEYDDDIQFLLAKLRKLEENDDSYEGAKAIVSKILSKIDISEVLAHMGAKVKMDSDDITLQSVEMKKQQLVECLLLEGKLLTRQHPSCDHLQEIYVDLHKLLDKKDAKLRSFCIDYAEACGHFATAVKLIEQEINEKGASRILDEKLIQCYRKLGWDHCATLTEGWLLRKFPQILRPF